MPDASNPTPSSPRVSEKDRKADILAAYHDLLKRYEERAAGAKEKEQRLQKTEEEVTVKTASGYTADKIIQGCRNLEGTMRQYLAELADNLLRELKSLKDVQEAIRLEEKRLQEIHDIKLSATVLAELIDTYKLKEKEFEEQHRNRLEELGQEIRHRREEWQREEAERTYILEQKRRKEEDADRLKREIAERELEDRRHILAVQEEELKAFRKRAEKFDTELQAAVEQARKDTEKNVHQEEKVKAEFLAQQVLREKEIAELKITSFEAKVAEQRREIDALKSQLALVSREAKEIALKVIEGAAGAASYRNLQRMSPEERQVEMGR